MRHWSKEKMHEFTDYVEAQLAATPDAGSPWHAEWVMETIPTWKSDEKKILDCRLELMRRRAHIEVAGPKSIDDWILKWEMDRGIGPRGLDQSIQDLFHGNQRAPPPEIRRYVRRTRPGGPAKRPAPP